MIKKGCCLVIILSFLRTGLVELVPPESLKFEPSGGWSPEPIDLVRDQRGDSTYIYGYPEGSQYYKDTLVVDDTNPFKEPTWIEGD